MRTLLFSILTISFLASCSDDERVMPSCVEGRLDDFKIASACTGDNLTSWIFRDEVVWCFATTECGIVTGSAEIYDADCNLLCTLGNGITTCQGFVWSETASEEELVWISE